MAKKLVWPYFKSHILSEYVTKMNIEDLAREMRKKRYDLVHIESKFFSTPYSEKAKEAARIANKKLAFASMEKMTDSRLISKRNRPKE